VPLDTDADDGGVHAGEAFPCTLRFHVATEGGWDIGGAMGLLAAALATGAGMPLSVSILQSLAGVAAISILLRRYYANGPILNSGRAAAR
jgi:hypothetical protein